jgi:hypothetical protein
MSVGSISFWQQDANYWNQAQARDRQLAQSSALITAMGGAMTNEATGLASIANQTALNRVKTELTAAIQSALQQSQSGGAAASSGGSTSSSSSGASASSTSTNAVASSTPTSPTPAIGTGTVPLTANTSLLTLGIPENGAITVNDGTNTTTYSSTGADTVKDLLNAINTNAYGNAQVSAWLDVSGHLVITAKNTTDPVSVGGIFASNIGFGSSNDSFQPTVPPASASSPTSASTSPASSSTASSSSATATSGGSGTNGANGTSGSATSSTASSTGSTSSWLLNSAGASQTGGTAEYLLASTGLGGTLLNMLA